MKTFCHKRLEKGKGAAVRRTARRVHSKQALTLCVKAQAISRLVARHQGGLPGLNPVRLLALMQAAIVRCKLDLTGAVVLTEAGSNAYVVTPVLAALAGATRVYAVVRSTRFGSACAVREQAQQLAVMAGVGDVIRYVSRKTQEIIGQADIVTNSGHVRPIDAQTIGWMKPQAVVPLMYESWELRMGDIDLSSARRRAIAVAGTNERQVAVGVFDFLGVMAVKGLLDAGIAVQGTRILLLCDNAFRAYIRAGLVGCGAVVDCRRDLEKADRCGCRAYDAIVLALHPGRGKTLEQTDARTVATTWPGAVVLHFWGNMDRRAFQVAGVPVWPLHEPRQGHMGVLPSEVGPESIVRLQSGGLKVGEILWRARHSGHSVAEAIACAVQTGFGQRVCLPFRSGG